MLAIAYYIQRIIGFCFTSSVTIKTNNTCMQSHNKYNYTDLLYIIIPAKHIILYTGTKVSIVC